MPSQLPPVFIFGSGRSGTTLLFELLRRHPEVAWVSRLTDRFPALPPLALASRSRLLRRFRPFQPSTDSINWYRHCGVTVEMLRHKGASLTEDDVTPSIRKRLRRAADAQVRWMGGRRFMNKSTMNTMRIRMIHDVFPEARFVHIIRNGYAVASSLVRVRWWPDADIWWLGTTPRRWEAEGGDPYELAARNWRRQVTEILDNQSAIPAAQFLECRYEDLIAGTRPLLRRIAAFCDMEWSDRYERALDEVPVVARNTDKWREQLDDHAKRVVTEEAGDLIARLGYPVLT